MGVEAEQVRIQVDRLVRSKAFETSEVHRHLLHYLAEKTLAGEGDRLKEYTIGLEAFSKPPTYDPKQDSIVRLQIGRLRQKLSAYYHEEGTADPLVITIPKGAFQLKLEANAEPVKEPPASWWTARRLTMALSAALLVVTVWAAVSTLGLVRLSRETAGVTARWTQDLQTVWSPFLQSKRPLLLCIGTPLFVRLPNLGFFRDPKANEWHEVEKSERVAAVRKSTTDEILPWYAFTGAGEASAAVLISQLLATRKPEISLTRSNLLSWQQIMEHDVVFVGPPKYNVQLQSAVLTQDIVVEPGGIRNLKPKPGEPVFLQDQITPGKQSEGETHALISLTGGPSGVGQFLVIAGNASADTFAAAEWLTQPWRAAELLRHLRTPSGETPRYYEMVLKVSYKQGIPVRSSYVFHHVLTGPRPAPSK